MKKNIIFCLLLINLFFICSILSGCGGVKLSSDWRDHQIVIDGKYTDWGRAESYYNEKAKVGINLLNDKDYLYICLITRNRQIETKLIESGFVAWFDPEGGNKKVFGIRFPTGLKSMGDSLEEKRDITQDWQDQEDKSGLIDREKERWRDKEFNKHLELLEKLQDKLEIVKGPFDIGNKEKHFKPPLKGDKNEHPGKGFFKDREGPGNLLSLDEAAKFGIEAKVGRENDYFVYELKVPLVKSVEHPYAIEVKTDKPIGLGLEISMSEMGMMGPPGRGVSGGEGFSLWATVTLSSRGLSHEK
ncbi:MAG: hypothetical protein MUC39_05760 [Candidatus Omnitrophica bacterium]|jgi:hypothetical protein|nr:hypothetical protein [Candidatus Omnitrophota bacterium]